MNDTIFMAHSGLRYLVLLAAVVAIVTAAMGLRAAGPSSKAERVAGAVFAGVLDLQVLLGIVLLTMWPFYAQLIGHITMMVAAAAAVHMGSVVARRREAQASKYRLIGYVAGLVAIIGGILAIQRPIL
ncbi:MAG TPA: hypothetical protein VK928_06365 [Longimicrobiales bacterium]|nr:hypothetical protein [Longimicrobiales bacterium]